PLARRVRPPDAHPRALPLPAARARGMPHRDAMAATFVRRAVDLVLRERLLPLRLLPAVRTPSGGDVRRAVRRFLRDELQRPQHEALLRRDDRRVSVDRGPWLARARTCTGRSDRRTTAVRRSDQGRRRASSAEVAPC